MIVKRFDTREFEVNFIDGSKEIVTAHYVQSDSDWVCFYKEENEIRRKVFAAPDKVVRFFREMNSD